jgi:hypothetical protein
MCKKVLACPKTTLDFMRNLASRAEHSSQIADQAADQLPVEIFRLVEAQSIKLYIPPHVLAFLHHYLRDQAGDLISSEGMKQLLWISCSNLPVDYDVLLPESLKLAAGHDEFDVCETLCWLIAKSLKVDFFLAHSPDYFAQMSLHQRGEQSGEDVQIISIEGLISQFCT